MDHQLQYMPSFMRLHQKLRGTSSPTTSSTHYRLSPPCHRPDTLTLRRTIPLPFSPLSRTEDTCEPSLGQLISPARPSLVATGC